MWKKVFIRNGSGPYEETALFDTGAGVSLVDSELADSLGLRFLGRSITLKGVSGRVFRAFEFEAMIYVPETRVSRRQNVYVPEVPVQVDGKIIIGRDYMRATRMGMQYENGDKVWSGTRQQRPTPSLSPQPPPLGLALLGLALLFLVGVALFGS